jgi:hypothetical protein
MHSIFLLITRLYTELHACGFSGVGSDHPGAPGGSAAVQTQAGADVIIVDIVGRGVIFTPPLLLSRCGQEQTAPYS